MFDAWSRFAEPSLDFVWTQLLAVAAYPLDPRQRVFWLYLCCSAVMAIYVFRKNTRADPARRSSVRALLGFLFPGEIWRTESAWLDVRYFFFHQIFRLVIYGAFLAGALNLAAGYVAGGAAPAGTVALTRESGIADIAISTGYMFVLIALVDLVSYSIHYLQHRVPILWAFHKVHHSLEVMHPLSNYREHPVDNIAYAAGTGAAYGFVMALTGNLLGYVPGMPTLLGVPLLLLAFNLLGYNLRHSHIWLRWPGRWSMAFASPAHHHIHHSSHPDQTGRNFAFVFPIWDVLFGTYLVPETNKDVRFGLAEDDATRFTSCLGIYFIPFKNILTPVFERMKRLIRVS